MKNLFSWLSDGIDMQESLALLFTLIWAGVVAVFSVKSYLIGLDVADNEFFWSVTWPTIIVAAFYYGFKVAIGLGSRSFSNKLISRQETNPPPEEPEPPELSKDWRDYV
jgi:hypothetical protein